MSRLYGTVEPTVIDDELLNTAIHEQGPQGEAGKIARDEGINYAEVLSLRLDYRNILKIGNLWCFHNLTKLQLDNNIIEKIEGIELLVHLRWLDLSFNHIEFIEGLDTLTDLEDLTLYHNRITRIENMDTLTKLQVFSIGKNDIVDLDNLLYLRKFKCLRTLNVGGNKVCLNPEYQQYVYAFLPQVDYLDYKLIDPKAREKALEAKHFKVAEMESDEQKAEEKLAKNLAKAARLEEDRKAAVEYLNGAHLFDSLFSDDPDGQKLNSLPGAADILQPFHDEFAATCVIIHTIGKAEYARRKEEVKHFWECIEEATGENKRQGMQDIEKFLQYKVKTFHALNASNDRSEAEELLSEYNKEINNLWNKLMNQEMQLVDQLEEAIKEFDRNISELCSAFLERVQEHMAKCRELENQFNEKLSELSMVILEKVLKNEIEDDITDELRAIFVDKDTVSNALQASHDLHLQKIDNREDEITNRINTWKSNLLDEIHQKQEIERNRERVSEISTLLDHLRDEAFNYELPSV